MSDIGRRGAELLNRVRLVLATGGLVLAGAKGALSPSVEVAALAIAAVASLALGLRLRRPDPPAWLAHLAPLSDVAFAAGVALVSGGTGGFVPTLLPVLVLAHALPLQRERIVVVTTLCAIAMLGLHTLRAGPEAHFAAQFATLVATGTLAWVLVWRVRTLLGDAAEREHDVDRLSRTFARYFSPQVARLIAQHGEGALATGRREITVMFADLSGFTTFSESASAEAVVTTLSQYLDELCRVALAQGGTLDKFMGDEVMVVFGAPAPQEDHAARALQAARDMLMVSDLLNQERIARGQPALGLTIGVNTGEAVIGPIGSELRVQYTAIGDTINVAKRLQGHARAGEIVAGARTLEMAGETGRRVEEIHVKGRSTPVFAARIVALAPVPQAASDKR